MKQLPGQVYMDLGSDGDTFAIADVDPTQLPGQTTFDITDTGRIFSMLGDGTTYTL